LLLFFLEMGSHELFAGAGLILLISPSQVDRVAGVSPWCPAGEQYVEARIWVLNVLTCGFAF
jgi:hypothetical protein